MAVKGEKVVIDGTDLIRSDWVLEEGNIYKTKLAASTDQVFYENDVMMLARWPNMNFNENWIDGKKWGRTGQGSERGKIKSDELAVLGKSLKGAKIFVKIGKGNNCFSRDIVAHENGSNTLEWDDTNFYDNPKFTAEDGQSKKIKNAGLHNNRFFVRDHRLLLDAKQEWFYNNTAKELLFISPDGNKPSQGEVSIKRRVYGFKGDGIENIELHGIDFFACTAHFTKTRRLTIENSRFYYPYELHNMYDNKQIQQDQRPVYIQGEHCLLQKCLVMYSPGSSIFLKGRDNRIENCVVTEGSRHGRHNDSNITLHYDHKEFYYSKNDTKPKKNRKRWEYSSAEGNTVAHSTVYNGSGIGVYLLGQGPSTAEYNHVFNVGLYCTDVSALYIPLGKKREWTGFHHNWVHDINGIGIRCDQDGEKVLFHHNVVWNCKAGGKANGYEMKIYNNTIYVDNPKHAFLMVKQKQLKVVDDWPIQNNAVFRLADRMDLREWAAMNREERKQRRIIIDIPDSEVIHNNYIIKSNRKEKLFVNKNEDEIDLRPAKNSELIDAGILVKGINDNFKCSAPDIGAYEYGGDYWTAGANWWPNGIKPPKTMAEATKQAHEMSNGQRLYREGHKVYGKQ
jgi:hypothetical protein